MRSALEQVPNFIGIFQKDYSLYLYEDGRIDTISSKSAANLK